MAHYSNQRFGRVFDLSFFPGDDIYLNVERLLSAESITEAVFLAGCGTLKRCVSHYATKSEGGYEDIPVRWEDIPLQLCGVQGFIEKGRAHLHGVIGSPEFSRTVHLHKGCVCLDGFRLVLAELIQVEA